MFLVSGWLYSWADQSCGVNGFGSQLEHIEKEIQIFASTGKPWLSAHCCSQDVLWCCSTTLNSLYEAATLQLGSTWSSAPPWNLWAFFILLGGSSPARPGMHTGSLSSFSSKRRSPQEWDSPHHPLRRQIQGRAITAFLWKLLDTKSQL